MLPARDNPTTDFSEWYSEENIRALVCSKPKQMPLLRYIFSYSGDDADPYKTFINQFRALIFLKNTFKVPVYFISMRPGAVMSSHFIVGIIVDERLIIINPLGDEPKDDFYKMMFKVKDLRLVQAISVSNTVIQNDRRGIVSCGPICVELLNHLSTLPKDTILKMASGAFKQKKLIYSKQELEHYSLNVAQVTWSYNSIDIAKFLSDKLATLLQGNPEHYESGLEKIRVAHKTLVRPGQTVWLAEQSLVHKMLETKIEHLEQEEDFLMLKTELTRLESQRLVQSSSMQAIHTVPSGQEIKEHHMGSLVSSQDQSKLDGASPVEQKLRQSSVPPEVIEELGRILDVIKKLDISRNDVNAIAVSGAEGSTLRLAAPPSRHVDENPERSLEVFTGYWQGEPKFRRLLERNGLVATGVSGAGFNCFINSLLQHATKQYRVPQFGERLINRIKAKAGISQGAVMRHNDTPEALKILQAINEIYDINLEVYFVQINEQGQPIVLPALLDEGLQSVRQPVVIWQQPGHYVAIASRKLESLCKLDVSEGKEEQPQGIKTTHNQIKAKPLDGPIAENLAFLEIPYDRTRLQAMIDKLPLASEIAAQITGYINNIERQVSEIRQYQSKKSQENFYPSIRTVILEIRNSADAIHDLVRPYHPSLSHSLKQLLLEWIKPLEGELKKHPMSREEQSALVLKTRRLYAEQSFISRDSLVNEAFLKHLEKLKGLLLDASKPLPRCYIRYAWPSQESEYWVQPFLSLLYDHLTTAGIRVVMDIRDQQPGESIYPFLRQYQESNYVILIGTESLLQKHCSDVPNIIQTALNTLFEKIEQDQTQLGESRLYPLLISGALKTAYPEYYHEYSTIKDAREVGYVGALKALIDWIYQSRLESVRHPYLRLWRTFTDSYDNYKLPQTDRAIEEELGFSYHQKYLDYLKKSVQYQSVSVQESIQYDPETELKMIDALKSSQGSNLFDSHGQQFQRPRLNIDFIERHGFDTMRSSKSSQLHILQGAPGVGKTELAKFYFLHPAKPYDLRAWFDASSKETLSEQYLALAASHGVKFVPYMPMQAKLKRVKQWLEQQDCLLVYDNVPDISAIKELLPEPSKQHMVITNRNSLDLPIQYHTLSVGPLKEEEAIALLCRITGYSPEQFFLKELVHKLELLPSDLVRAGNYMKAKSINSYQYWLRYQRHKEYLRAHLIKYPINSPRRSLVLDEPLESVKTIQIPNPAALLPLSYDRKALEEMVANLLIPESVTERVAVCFNNIEGCISEIRQFQDKKNPENFCHPILATLQKVRNIAGEIYTLIEFYHPNFPDLIRNRIIEGIVPLEREVQKRLAGRQRQQNAFGSKRLCAEQSFVSRKPDLIQHLSKLKVFLKDKLAPRCYICYAWPSNPEEYWVQPFLSTLYDHLKAAGIEVRIDIRDVKQGESVYEFMKQYQMEDYLILVGTESLLQKHDSSLPHAMQIELNIALSRTATNQMQWGESRIYPLLISGTIQTAYPKNYHHLKVQDAKEDSIGYLGTLKGLIKWMYGEQSAMNEFWRTLYDGYPNLPQTPSAVEAEVELGYHKQSFETLKQNSDYQRVEAQEKTPHSPAVQTEIISTWMRSKGYNPQPLLEEKGQQFQRPYDNPDFIERPKLWEKMTQHFATAEHQILTLTAHGLGGMGKTELAQRYYLHPPKAYALRALFDASSKEILFLQYIGLAESNGMKFAPDMPIEEKVVRVKKWLEEKKDCLLIYDNVPGAETITQWLPKQGKHHILITSRNAVDWSAHQKLDVDVMEEEEAIALICKITGYSQSEPQLKELVHALGLLPLALVQAAAYMKVKNKTVSDYLLEYQQSQDLLMTPNIDAKHEPAWVTFNMNFESLQEECPAALITLKQASWLSHRAIPEVLLFLMTNSVDTKPKELLWDDIKEQVRRYSLMQVDVERLQLAIHPLLQDIIRSWQKAIEQVKIFGTVCDALDTLSNFDEKVHVTYRESLSHAERLHYHAQIVSQAVSGEKIEGVEIPELLSLKPACLEGIYLKLSLPKKALGLLTQQKKIYEKYYGADHLKTGNTLMNLGNAYVQLGQHTEAKQYCQRALTIKKSHYGEEHFETADTLMNLGNVYIQSGKFEEARQYYEKALTIKASHYGENHFAISAVLTNLGNIHLELGKLEEAKQYSEKALMIRKSHYGEDDFEIAKTLVILGKICFHLGKLEEAKHYYEKALKIQEGHYDKEHFEIATTLIGLWAVYANLGKLEEAKHYHEKALAIQENHYGKDYFEITAALGNLGTICQRLGKLEEAQEYYKRAVRIEEEHYGKDHFKTTTTLSNLGNIYLQLGKFEEAKEYYERALTIKKNFYGEGHFETATILNNLGNIYLQLGKPKKARQYYERALTIKKNHYGEDHFQTTLPLMNLGNIYAQSGDFEEASQYYERALTITKSHYGEDYFEIADILNNLGNVYTQLGKIEEAKQYYQKALRIKEDHFKDHIEITKTLVNLGNVYLQLGEVEEAKKYCERALKIEEDHYGKGHIETTKTLVNLGNIYLQLGEVKEAKKYCVKALRIEVRYYGKDHVETAKTLLILGNIYFQLEKFEEARQYYEKALRIRKGHFEASEILRDLGKLYFQLGKLKEAQKYCERALRIEASHYGKKHVRTLKTLVILGNICFQLERFEDARHYYQRALAIQESYFGINPFEIAVILMNLGNICIQSRKFEEAKEYYEKALKIQESLYGKEHLEIAKTLNNLGNAYLQSGEFEEAKKYYEKSLIIKENHYGKDHLGIATTLHNLAIANVELNKIFIALNYLQHAQRIYRQTFPTGHPHLITIETLLQTLSHNINSTAQPSSVNINPSLFDITRIDEQIQTLTQQGIQHYQAKQFKEALPFFQEVLKLQQKINPEPNETLAALHFNIGASYLGLQDYLSAHPNLQSAYEMQLALLDPTGPVTRKVQEGLTFCESNLTQWQRQFLSAQRAQTDTYLLEHKIPIQNTSLIDHLRVVTHLAFTGVRDDDYQVDAVLTLEDESTFEHTKILQRDLNTGLFFQYSQGDRTHSGFVLEGINLRNSNPSRGEQIRSYLLKQSEPSNKKTEIQ